MTALMHRRLLLRSALAAPVALTALAARADAAVAGLRLAQFPEHVFKTADLPRERTEAWFVTVALESGAQTAPVLTGLDIALYAGAQLRASTHYDAESARALAIQGAPAPTRLPNGDPRQSPVFWPFVFRLVCRARAELMIDRMRVSVQLQDGDVTADISIGTYTQRSELIFPFRGQGIVTQGGAANGGHRNRSGQFAIDAMGLSANYAVQTGPAFAQNGDLSGFGRDLIAPAAGRVVEARGDRPDQPVPGESNEDYHLPEFRGAGDPGNHVVIDHGAGEFSMVAHFMAGSLRVARGERVAQGQPIGRLGNSGDSFAPHVHHQLQDGPLWQFADGLPCRFHNIASDRLTRGEFFVAS